MKRVLLVSPHFPPVNAPDCHRIRISLPYYREFGWDVEVLAVEAQHRPDWMDQSLMTTLPADVPLHYTGALPRHFTQLLGINNLGIRALPQLFSAGRRLLKARPFDLVFFSTTQFITTTLGPLWLREFGVPYVIDLQDPWLTDYYDRPGSPKPPGGWKFLFAVLTALCCEEWAFRRAAGFISVSHHYFRELESRYDWFADRPRSLAPFGAPEADFALAHPAPVSHSGRRLLSMGSLGSGFSHSLHVLFSGLKKLRQTDPASANQLRFEFIGTSYAPTGHTRKSALPIAEAYGVADLVEEIPHRVGYLESLKKMKEADGLLLLGSDDPAYSPSKIYPYFMTGKPVLTLAHTGTLLEQIVTALKFSEIIHLLKPGEETLPPLLVSEYLGRAARNETAPPAVNANQDFFREHFSARSVTQRQCQLFDQALKKSRPKSHSHEA